MPRLPSNPLAKITTAALNREPRVDIRCKIDPWARGRNIIEVEFYRRPRLRDVRVLEPGMKARVPGAPEPRWRMAGDTEWCTGSILLACDEIVALLRYADGPLRGWKLGLQQVAAFTEIEFLRRPTEQELRCLSPMQGCINGYVEQGLPVYKNGPYPTTFRWRMLGAPEWRTDPMFEALNG